MNRPMKTSHPSRWFAALALVPVLTRAAPTTTSVFYDGFYNYTGGTGIACVEKTGPCGSGAINNTGFGYQALTALTTGANNTAVGFSALTYNTTGSNNISVGFNTLYRNTTGQKNIAIGSQALNANVSGTNNVAIGHQSLYTNTANFNTAVGSPALNTNTTGANNVAVGYSALNTNTTGGNDVAVGYQALYSNILGAGNVAVGYQALYSNTGSNNIAIGTAAGSAQTTGSNSIYIGNTGAVESGTIRIGSGSQTKTFVFGINGATVTGSAVIVSSTGQLGVASSSRRFKENIHPMADASNRLLQLRPVTFQYKQADEFGKKPLQYGLIAEEVNDVFPELVVLNQKGEPETVAYHLIASLLLNEFQKEHAIVAAQAKTLASQEERLASQAAELRDLKTQMADIQATNKAIQLALAAGHPKDNRIAMR